MTNEFNFQRCQMCEEEWIDPDRELVCERCVPALNIDLAVADIVKAIRALEDEPLHVMEGRLSLLKKLHSRLGEIIRKAEDDE